MHTTKLVLTRHAALSECGGRVTRDTARYIHITFAKRTVMKQPVSDADPFCLFKGDLAAYCVNE